MIKITKVSGQSAYERRNVLNGFFKVLMKMELVRYMRCDIYSTNAAYSYSPYDYPTCDLSELKITAEIEIQSMSGEVDFEFDR